MERQKLTIMKFNLKYFISSILFFILLAFIALFVHDNFIRPFIGDSIVVVWLYLTAKSFLKIPDFTLAVSVLIFAYAIETAQYFHIIKILGLQNCRPAVIILGSTFDKMDLVAYTLGFTAIISVNYLTNLFSKTKHTL